MVDMVCRCYTYRPSAPVPPRTSRARRTIATGDRPGSTNRTDCLGVSAVRELEPIACIRFEACSFDLEREVDVVARERVARVDGVARQAGVVEDLE